MPTYTLDDLTRLARDLTDADHAVRQAEAALKIAKDRARVLREDVLPSAFQEQQIDRLDLSDGTTFSLSHEVYASLPKDKREAAYTYLIENGAEALIKSTVSIPFERKQREAALKLQQFLKRRGFEASLEDTVHVQTLKAWIRERLEAGHPIAWDLLGARGVWEVNVVTLKKGK